MEGTQMTDTYVAQEEARTEAARIYLARIELACVELGPEMMRAIEICNRLEGQQKDEKDRK
jgi:hypothetical protein